MTKTDEFKCDEAIALVTKTATMKSKHYKVEPVAYMDVDDLIVQVKIKNERAKQAIKLDKQIDEVKDVAVYATKVLQRLLDEKTVLDKPEVIQTVITDYKSTTTVNNGESVITMDDKIWDYEDDKIWSDEDGTL